MNAQHSSRPARYSDLPDDILDRLRLACSQFEQKLLAGEDPRIEEFLLQFDPAHRPIVLEALLDLDLNINPCWSPTHAPDEAEYRQRFPDYVDAIARAFRDLHADRADSHDDRASDLSSQQSGSDASSSDPVPRLPEHLVIQRTLGRGTFGTVYLATDTNLKRRVAVKVLKQSWLHTINVRDMFWREAQTVANLTHPNLVTIYALLPLDAHGIAIEMQYVEGDTLFDLRESWPNGSPNIDELVEVMEQVAQAVHFIHTAGDGTLVHRDLKPANIILDKSKRPYVVDFGLAALTSQLAEGQEPAGGTRTYMSPEQVRYFRGQKPSIDSRSDIWSLGVILYEMLTGRLPFNGSPDEIMDAIEREEPIAARYLRPEISPTLETIVHRCLFKHPKDRFQSAEHLAEALHACRIAWKKKEQYLLKVQDEYRCFQHVVVLDTIEDVPEDPFLDQTLIEILPEIEQEVEDEDNAESIEASREPRRGSLVELAREIRQLVVVGDNGAGKSTTLRHFCYTAVSSILQDPLNAEPCPVYLKLRLSERNLVERLSGTLKVSTNEFEDRLTRGEFVLLFDGLNEVDQNHRREVVSELQDVLDRFPDIGLILTSRPGAYHRQLPLRVFRLQPLTDEQMVQFLERNCSTPEEARTLVATRERQPRLWRWGRNPMMLFMLASVGKKRGGKLPANRAQLIRQFMQWIFDREARKCPQTDPVTKERLLGEVAFATRMSGKVAFSRDEFFRTVKQQQDERGFQIDSLRFLNEVLDNNLIEADGESLAFVHELYQEYFAATSLKRRYEVDPDIVMELATQENWEEPLTLLYGLLKSRRNLFSQMVQHNLIVAARCLASEDEPAPEAVGEFENAINRSTLRAASRDQRRTILGTAQQ